MQIGKYVTNNIGMYFIPIPNLQYNTIKKTIIIIVVLQTIFSCDAIFSTSEYYKHRGMEY